MDTINLFDPSNVPGTVRPAHEYDAGVIAAIAHRSWQAQYAPHFPADALSQLSRDELEAMWRNQSALWAAPAGWAQVALAGSTVVGVSCCAPTQAPDSTPTAAELVALWIDPAQQRQGHASRLLNESATFLAAQGVSMLTCWVWPQDTARLEFLRSAGFEPDGARRTFESDAEQDAPTMIRVITHLPDTVTDSIPRPPSDQGLGAAPPEHPTASSS